MRRASAVIKAQWRVAPRKARYEYGSLLIHWISGLLCGHSWSIFILVFSSFVEFAFIVKIAKTPPTCSANLPRKATEIRRLECTNRQISSSLERYIVLIGMFHVKLWFFINYSVLQVSSFIDVFIFLEWTTHWFGFWYSREPSLQSWALAVRSLLSEQAIANRSR